MTVPGGTRYVSSVLKGREPGKDEKPCVGPLWRVPDGLRAREAVLFCLLSAFSRIFWLTWVDMNARALVFWFFLPDSGRIAL